MIALLQVVTSSHVTVDKQIIGSISRGLLVFLAVEKDDSLNNADRLAQRVLGYRIFEDQKLKISPIFSKRMRRNSSEISAPLNPR